MAKSVNLDNGVFIAYTAAHSLRLCDKIRDKDMQGQSNETQAVSSITVINRGDLFTSGMQTLVNPINCKGAMGKGLALEFKKHYPLMYKDYQKRCKNGLVLLGQPYLWKETPSSSVGILNFPTKGHWKNGSNLCDIRNGLQYLALHAEEWGITSLAMPALGCGLGGLSWEVVLPEIETYLAPLNIPIRLYKEGLFLEKTVTKRKIPAQHSVSEPDISSGSLDLFFTKKSKNGPNTPVLVEESDKEEIVVNVASLTNK